VAQTVTQQSRRSRVRFCCWMPSAFLGQGARISGDFSAGEVRQHHKRRATVNRREEFGQAAFASAPRVRARAASPTGIRPMRTSPGRESIDHQAVAGRAVVLSRSRHGAQIGFTHFPILMPIEPEVKPRDRHGTCGIGERSDQRRRSGSCVRLQRKFHFLKVSRRLVSCRAPRGNDSDQHCAWASHINRDKPSFCARNRGPVD